ncbi:hypothetical protein BC628DRAFT_1418816 [Trametes gibbosa]|nr:hypothetical protein BC628DRAFT_1418816 [Trametes gibbosa]
MNDIDAAPQVARPQSYVKQALMEIDLDVGSDSETSEIIAEPATAQPMKTISQNASAGPSARSESHNVPDGGIPALRERKVPNKPVQTIPTPRYEALGKPGNMGTTKCALLITPLVSPKKLADEVRPASSSRVPPSGLPAFTSSSATHFPATPPAPTVTSSPSTQQPVAAASQPSKQHPPATAMPTTQPVIARPEDIRALISTMRANGQLAPPPVIDYVLQREIKDSRKGSPSVSSSGPRGHTAPRSNTRALEEDQVERSLDDFVGDSMDVDPPEPEPGLDPHNIDDLYGDIAPRYLGEPPNAPLQQSAGRPWDELRVLLQRQRAKDEARTSAAHSRDKFYDSRRPRKGHARQLRGKVLRKKQTDGLTYNVYDRDDEG